MKFCWCTISVNNMDESLSFYRDIVGLKLDRRFNADPETEIAFLGEGETKVELICGPNQEATGNKQGISIGFEVESVNEMIGFLNKKGIEVKNEPVQPNPHVRFFFVKDPNGLSVQFVENI